MMSTLSPVQIQSLVNQLPSTIKPLSEATLQAYAPYARYYGIQSPPTHSVMFTYKQERLATQIWHTPSDVSTLWVVHGFLDHIGLYGKVIDYARARNMSIVAMDLVGHGLSSGERAAINSFDDYVQSLLALMQCVQGHHEITLPSEWHSLSQSTGCAIISNMLLFSEHPNFAQHVLLAPLVRSRHWDKLRWLYFLLRLWIKSVKRRFVNSSHDERFNQRLLYDPLQSKRIPLCWLGAMEQWSKKVLTATACSERVTLLQGTGDLTVDWNHNIPILQRCFLQQVTHWLDGANHHLINESDTYWIPIIRHLDQAFGVGRE